MKKYGCYYFFTSILSIRNTIELDRWIDNKSRLYCSDVYENAMYNGNTYEDKDLFYYTTYSIVLYGVIVKRVNVDPFFISLI